jgi:uracil-DNA glycosylase
MPHKNEISQLIADVKEEILYLQELGVGEFDAEIPEGRVSSVGRAKPKVESVKTAAAPPPEIPKIEKEDKKKTNGSRLAVLPSLSKRSKITPSTSATLPSKPPQKDPAILTPKEESLLDTTPTLAETEDTIDIIRADIGNCIRCPLSAERKQVVHTTGNFQADLMFVGEAPGADEDAQGFPFVGRAGQLLTKIIEGIGYKREAVAIGNINRCRPPGNRAPTLSEAHTCRPFLLREIMVIRPKVIVVLGNTAMHNLLDTKVGITKMRGNFQDYFGVKVMPTFHPAYLLRDPNKKREVWEDMKKVRDYLKTAM